MAITQDWKIKSRSHVCAHSGRPFADGDEFYTAIFAGEAEGEFSREDFASECWEAVRESIQPFSFWKSVYEAPPPPDAKPTLAPKEGPEALLRRLVEENEPHTENARYILAVMLERKKALRPTDTQFSGDRKLLIYEHAKTGEVFIIADPELQLSEVDRVRAEVADLLGGGGPGGAGQPGAPPTGDGAPTRDEEAPVPPESGGDTGPPPSLPS